MSEDNQTLKKVFLSAVIGVFIFLLIISLLIVKNSNDDTCGVDRVESLAPGELASLSTVLNDSNDYILQEVVFNPKRAHYYKTYEFCFTGTLQASDNIELRVINIDEDVLGKRYFTNFSNSEECISLGEQNLGPQSVYLGLECVNCNSSNNLTLSTSLSVKRPLITSSGVSNGYSLDYTLIPTKKCSYFTLYLFQFMLIYLFLNFFIWLIYLFVKKIEDVGFNGWN